MKEALQKRIIIFEFVVIVIDVFLRMFSSGNYHWYGRLTPNLNESDSTQANYNVDFVTATYVYVGLSLMLISILRVILFGLCLRWIEFTRCVFYLECVSFFVAFFIPHKSEILLLLAGNILLTCAFYHDALPNWICLNLSTILVLNVVFPLVYSEPDTTWINQIIILTCTNMVLICFTTALTYAIQNLSQADEEVKRYQLIMNR